MSKEALEMARARWLRLHDMQTAGIMGLFPAIKELPVRFTRTLDKERKIFKFTRGVLIGWELHPVDQERVAASSEPEIVLQRLPKHLFVRVANPGMPQHHGLEEQVYAVKPMAARWCRDNEKNATVVRRGFTLVADFSGTAHSYVGSTLSSAIVDGLHVEAKPSREDMVKSYNSI